MINQANKRIIQAISEKCNIPIEKCIITIQDHANTSAASIPLALDQAIKEKNKTGDNIYCIAFGAVSRGHIHYLNIRRNYEKIAFISGASRGIGYAILKEMLRNNYITIATTTTTKGADLISETITSHQGEGLALIGDLKDGASTVKRWENEILDQFQTLPDILIANAGITKDQLTIRMTEEQWDDVLKVNLTSTFLLSQSLSKQ